MPNRIVVLGLLGVQGLVFACSGASSSSSSMPAGGAGATASGGTAGAGGAAAGAPSGGSGFGGAGAGGGGGSESSSAGIGAGGSSGAGEAGGTGGKAGAGACASPFESLVNGLCVAKSVAINGGYSIDATEVTQGQYAAWLKTSPALPSASDATCGWNTSYEPPASCMDSTAPVGDEYPVVCVDWCDARAYCAGVGKRLCGKIGGGSNATTDYANAATSQWYRACSSGGVNAYPYGNTREPSACDGYDHGTPIVELPVGSLSTCQSSVAGYQGVFDLSGNVHEWEDSCSDAIESGFCLLRGGSVVGMINCDTNGGQTPTTTFDNIGIRCCSP